MVLLGAGDRLAAEGADARVKARLAMLLPMGAAAGARAVRVRAVVAVFEGARFGGAD